MKASTLFVISIALVFALGAVATSKYIGMWGTKTQASESRVKEEPVLVLVAISDLYPGVSITAADVRVRELHPEERALLEQNRNVMMPPFTSAAHHRVPTIKIKADQPLLRTFFEERQPDPLSQRILPGMRAVTVGVPKERCGGGLIQLGESVDVLLTTKITDPADPNKQYIREACIARDCKVIVKRDNLRTIIATDPPGPISFTLQANPYRAALIEYAQQKGQLTLMPLPGDRSPQMEMRMMDSPMTIAFSDMSSPEYSDEDVRVDQIKKGIAYVGDADLERIFKVVPPPRPIPPIRVINIRGIYPSNQMIFGDPRASIDSTTPTVTPINNKQVGAANFQLPGAGQATPDCPTCGDKNKPAGGATVAGTGNGVSGATFAPPR